MKEVETKDVNTVSGGVLDGPWVIQDTTFPRGGTVGDLLGTNNQPEIVIQPGL